MAIRRFKQKMKPVVWIITILFLGSLIAGYVMSFRSHSSARSVAYELNGEKIDGYDVARGINGFINNYTNYLGDKVDRNVLTLLAFDESITKQLTLKVAKELKIEVPSSEVDKEYAEIESKFPDHEQFKRALAAQGYTRAILKNEIESNLLIQHTVDYLKENAKVSQEAVENYFNENKYTQFNGKTLDEVKDQITNTLKDEQGLKDYLTLIGNARKDMKLTDVSDQYKEYLPKVEYELDGFKVTNVDLGKKIINALMVTNGDLEKAKEMAKEEINNQIKIAEVAKEKGIKVAENLPLEYTLTEYKKDLQEKLKSSVIVTDQELQKYFDNNKAVYDTPASADAYIAMLKVQPSETDKDVAKAQAEKILKEATPENFGELAKEYSQCPSSANGGDLGTFSKGQMVKPFEDAVFEGKPGEIYPKVVETQFGEHIIYIVSRNDEEGTAHAKHILITVKPSEATVAKTDGEVKDIVAKLEKKEITFDDLKEDKTVTMVKRIDGIGDGGYVPGLGYNEELAKAIYATPEGQIKSIEIKDDYYIFDKISETPFKAALLSEVKDRVKADYINYIAQEEMNKIVEPTVKPMN
ncbi:peptidylprolyl isomerase [Cetobacterium sp. SF1]|uniref:peptidylprolyl isomerase n=1 Tax=unclassified Cetobacterium TaxID=2630983 RepID=UPI003CFB85D2